MNHYYDPENIPIGHTGGSTLTESIRTSTYPGIFLSARAMPSHPGDGSSVSLLLSSFR